MHRADEVILGCDIGIPEQVYGVSAVVVIHIGPDCSVQDLSASRSQRYVRGYSNLQLTV